MDSVFGKGKKVKNVGTEGNQGSTITVVWQKGRIQNVCSDSTIAIRWYIKLSFVTTLVGHHVWFWSWTVNVDHLHRKQYFQGNGGIHINETWPYLHWFTMQSLERTINTVTPTTLWANLAYKISNRNVASCSQQPHPQWKSAETHKKEGRTSIKQHSHITKSQQAMSKPFRPWQHLAAMGCRRATNCRYKKNVFQHVIMERQNTLAGTLASLFKHLALGTWSYRKHVLELWSLWYDTQ